MEGSQIINYATEVKSEVTILDVLGVDLCRDAILDHVHIRDIVRSERVCRRWQGAVLDYLPRCRLTLSIYKSSYEYKLSIYQRSKVIIPHGHRTVMIRNPKKTAFSIRNVLEKLGLSIVNLETNRSDDEFYEHIASFCPRLRQIELKGIYDEYTKKGENISEEKLGKAFQNMALEKVKLVRCDNLSGKCFQLMNLDRLKSFTLHECLDFNLCHLKSNASSLQNVTSLDIFSTSYFRLFKEMLVLMDNMPKLEYLTYKGTLKAHELLESCSRLDHLKSIHLIECSNNFGVYFDVDDDFFEGLARGCKKLEYLKVSCRMNRPYGRGLAALVLRPSPGISLCIARVEDREALLNFLQPLNNELIACGRETITEKMLNDAFKLKGRDDPLELSLVYSAPENAKSYPALKIVLDVSRDVLRHILPESAFIRAMRQRNNPFFYQGVM